MRPQFLYPTSTQFPFDPVCAEIIRALEARNFDVPGMEVTVTTYGSGEQWMRHVHTVTGSDFKIMFERDQGPMPGGRWLRSGAVSSVAILRNLIHVYSDESGPTLRVYVGDNWEADRLAFRQDYGVNSRLNGERRTYLRYRGMCRCRSGLEHSHQGSRSPLLVADNDLGREYDPVPGEPTEYETATVFEAFRAYLATVLVEIESHPVAEPVDMFPEPAPLPVPAWAASLFCLVDHADVDRINQGKADPSELDAAHRYGLRGDGWRLCSLGVRNDGTVPEVAYDGFLWCGLPWADGGLNPVPPVPGSMRTVRADAVVRIRPKTANEIYIAD
ncbi:MAG TPA: hypothetical protein VMX11_00155, partial [Actinomycetes bacterium]|nr:hypothetical protein [Actinomycetes bacterium]